MRWPHGQGAGTRGASGGAATVAIQPESQAPASHASAPGRSDVSREGTVRRAVVLTALGLEYKAVRVHLRDVREETHPAGTVYERGFFGAEDETWEVLIVETGAGTAAAAVEAERALTWFEPQVILFVGVAGVCV